MILKFPDRLLDSLENGHMIIDDKFIVSYWNRWLAINTQISKEQIIGKSLKDFYPELNYNVLQRKIKTALRLKTPSFYDPNSSTKFIPINRNKVTTSSLTYMQQQVTISPYMREEDTVMISIYDISELHETKISLEREIDKVNYLNEVLEFDQEIIDQNIMTMKTSVDGTIVDVSTLFCKFFEYKKDDLIGKQASLLKSGNLPDTIYKEMWEILLNKKSWCGEIENKTANGGSKWVQSRITPIFDNCGELLEFNAVYHDITNKKLLEELYITDPLTKLYNRAHFDDIMNSITKHQRKADTDFSLIITDVDHFKSINDTYGHQVGDEALKDVANALKSVLRDNDIIARWGGEEFVIMLKNANIDEAAMIAEKLRACVENTKVQNVIDITCSFGLTKYYIGEDPHNTFKRVDDALYEAKKSGRNRVILKL